MHTMASMQLGEGGGRPQHTHHVLQLGEGAGVLPMHTMVFMRSGKEGMASYSCRPWSSCNWARGATSIRYWSMDVCWTLIDIKLGEVSESS